MLRILLFQEVRVVPDWGVFYELDAGVSDLVEFPPSCQSCSYYRVFETWVTCNGTAHES